MITTMPNPIEFSKKILQLMSNVFDNYFTFVAEKSKSYIKFLAER